MMRRSTPGGTMAFRARATVREAKFRSLWLASVAVIVILPLASLSAAPVETAQSATFTPPDRPMVLTRILRRPLPGGAQVTTRRSYKIHFSPVPDGYRIDGELISADADVPEPFEALAEIERNRPDTGLFPMEVDRRGMLLPDHVDDRKTDARVAGRIAMAQIPKGRMSSTETLEAQAFIGQVSANPVHTEWPKDLFNPEPGEHRSTQTIPLPDGKTGQVLVEINASSNTETGLLTSLTRRVTTMLGGSQRVTIETWILADP